MTVNPLPRLSRTWAMPNKATFKIKPIAELVARYVGGGEGWVDPFAGNAAVAELTNDLNPKTKAKWHVPAHTFVTALPGMYAGVLFDPPYSPRQVTESYAGVGLKATAKDTSAAFYSQVKRALAPKVILGGIVICFGWNSGGFGIKLGFELLEVLLVAHGGAHNDTIVTVERQCRMGRLLSPLPPKLGAPSKSGDLFR